MAKSNSSSEKMAFSVGEVVGLLDGVAGHAGDGFGHDVGVGGFVIDDEDADGGGFGHVREV